MEHLRRASFAALALTACAISAAPGSDTEPVGGDPATGGQRVDAEFVLGGRCASWAATEAELSVSPAGMTGELLPAGYDSTEFVLGLVFGDEAREPGVFEVSGALRYRGADVGRFEPEEASVLREAALWSYGPRGDLEGDRVLRVTGTLEVDDRPGRFAGALEVELEGNLPPMQPSCGGNGTLSVHFDAPR